MREYVTVVAMLILCGCSKNPEAEFTEAFRARSQATLGTVRRFTEMLDPADCTTATRAKTFLHEAAITEKPLSDRLAAVEGKLSEEQRTTIARKLFSEERAIPNMNKIFEVTRACPAEAADLMKVYLGYFKGTP